MIIRNNQGVLFNSLSSVGGNNTQSSIVGRVYHVVIDKNSPGFYGDWTNIGNVYYISPNKPVPSDINDESLKKLNFAKPLFPFNSYIPLIEELVLLVDLPSSNSSDVTDQKQIYYLSPINLFNNINHNSQAVFNVKENNSIKLGKSIEEKELINSLMPFEGDHILYGRWGQGLRLGSTLKFNETENFWSKIGNNGDPITLLVNGYNFPKNSVMPYVEDINRDDSSIYLTSTQIIPLEVSRLVDPNPSTSPLNPNKYSNSQIIISSNRITLNSKKDEIMLYSGTNIELSASQVIHLNSSNSILLNSPKIYLGVKSTGKTPTEPVLLGAKTVELLSKLLEALNEFSSNIRHSPPGSKGFNSFNFHAAILFGRLNILRGSLNNIYSETVFVSK
jgi:hypothetical protein